MMSLSKQPHKRSMGSVSSTCDRAVADYRFFAVLAIRPLADQVSTCVLVGQAVGVKRTQLSTDVSSCWGDVPLTVGIELRLG